MMILFRSRFGRIDNSDHDRHRHKRDVPVMPFAEASPGHARAIAKRLRHDIRMHVTMRVAHIDTRALAVLDCACVHAYAVRSAHTLGIRSVFPRSNGCAPSPHCLARAASVQASVAKPRFMNVLVVIQSVLVLFAQSLQV